MTPVVGYWQVGVMASGEVEGTPVEEGADEGRGLGPEDLEWALPLCGEDACNRPGAPPGRAM